MAEIRVRTKKPMGQLRPGDSIELGISAQVKIDGDDNWISMKTTTFVQPEEIGTDAHERAQSFLMVKFLETVDSTVELIRKASA